MKRTLVLAVLALSALPLRAEEPVDLSMMTRIRDEGLHNSQVMDTLFQLTDVIGPRLTGSPQAKQANEWTRDQFTRWGLVNAHLEGYPFGRGWSFSACQVRMVSPRAAVLLALPKAWTPGTNGPVRGPVIRIKTEAPKPTSTPTAARSPARSSCSTSPGSSSRRRTRSRRSRAGVPGGRSAQTIDLSSGSSRAGSATRAGAPAGSAPADAGRAPASSSSRRRCWRRSRRARATTAS